MQNRSSIGAIAVAATLLGATGIAFAFDDAKYPDLSGAWERTGGAAPRFDNSKPRGLTQEAPLTPEFQALYKASLADQAAGGQGDHTVYKCLAWGMPAMMNGYAPLQIVVLPETTYMLVDDGNDSFRRIFTDGRSFPADAEPAFTGYSIGKWIDTTGTGRYDTLEVETRYLRVPRIFDQTGIPFHEDGQAVIKERIYLDKANPKILHDEMTTTDNALTRPWTVLKSYTRLPRVTWSENNCTEGNYNIAIGNEVYLLAGDGRLMPIKKDQPAPDLFYFKQAPK